MMEGFNYEVGISHDYVFLLCGLLIIGCGGGGSSFNVPKEDSGVENGTVEVHSIAFISAIPQTIALKGTGGLESSVAIFKVVDKNNNPVSNRTVNFELSTEAGGLSLSNQNDLSNSAGLVQATVNAGNVATSVRVTATLDSNPSVTITSDELFVAELFAGEVASIDFISASPKTIALKGTGGPPRSETSALVFKVADIYGSPVPDQILNFELSTEVGGLSLSSTSAVSDSLGQVRVTVNSGNMPTHVRVCAFLANNPSIRTVSDLVAVGTGLPDADSVSISVEIYNSESWNYDNVQVPILFLAADIFNNFVPDGTVVCFTTEGGAIIDSSEVKDGVCEVKWHSGNPRPPDGLSQILAFCIGEESFTDLNSNGLYDANEPLTNDLAEPFRDDNQNGIHNEGEWYWDYNTNGEFDDKPNGIYNGTLCSDAAEASGACTKELVYVHASITLLMSGSFATINFYPDPVDLTGEEAPTVLITVADINNNPMPYKTKVELILTNGKFVDDSKSMEFKIGNTNLPGPTLHTVTILPTKDAVTSGKLVVKVTTPFDNESMDFTDVIDDYYEEADE